ncbi:MAG: hypothetical protein QXX46_04875 [Candidatus Anstonellales archaeon]
MNEGELREARKILMDAYMNPEKYRAEREAISLITEVRIKKPEELTTQDEELLTLTERALKGDKKAMKELIAELSSYNNTRLNNVTTTLEFIQQDPSTMSEEDRLQRGRDILGFVIASGGNFEKDDAKIALLLFFKTEQYSDEEKKQLEKLSEKYYQTAVEGAKGKQKSLQSATNILENLNRNSLAIYLLLPTSTR